MVTFLETGGAAIYALGQTVAVTFSFSFKNNGPLTTDTIPPVNVGNENFKFDLQLSDADLGAGGSDTISQTAVTASSVTLNTLLGLSAGATTAVETGTASVTVPSVVADCNKFRYICIEVKAGSGAGFTDVDTTATSNIKCHDLNARIVCAPGEFS